MCLEVRSEAMKVAVALAILLLSEATELVYVEIASN